MKNKHLKRLAEIFGKRRADPAEAAEPDARYAPLVEQLTVAYREVLDRNEPTSVELAERFRQIAGDVQFMHKSLLNPVVAPLDTNTAPIEEEPRSAPKALAEQIAAEYRQAMKDTPVQQQQALKEWLEEYRARTGWYYDTYGNGG